MKDRKFLRGVFAYIVALGITTVAGFMLLALSLFLPQDRIHENVVASTFFMQREGLYPLTGDQADTSMLDNWSESIILMESHCMHEENYAYILTNPLFTYDNEYEPLDWLAIYIEEEMPAPSEFYTRYWMGFRGIYRLLLTFFHHYQIKTYMAAGFFVLFAAVLLQLCKNLDNRMAITFAICMVLVKPNIISISIQYSCCFFIAMLGMLLVPWISRNPKYEALFFGELGMLTMYFDFYTTPLVTFGLPFVYLYALSKSRGESFNLLRAGRNAVWWISSYIGMWITKLLLTSMFTSASSFEAAFARVGMWLGIGEQKADFYEYDPIKALECVWKSVTVDDDGSKIAVCLLSLLAVLIISLIMKRKIDLRACGENGVLLLTAVLPIIWFCVAAQPTISHFFFQYRSVIVAFWALGVYFVQIVKKENVEKQRF